jgi:glycosyltransferase involved in cell wall biosynthesis
VPAEAAERFRREHLEQGFNVLFVGRFEDPRKGFDVLLEALALLPPSVRLTVAGKGDRTAAERTIGKLGLSPRVRFTGFLTDDELASAYAACDLFVCPSRMEGFGLTAAQALSAGRPLVASRVGNLPHLVGDDEQLVPSDRPEELAEAIWRFAGDPVLRATKGQRNRERALRLPSWEDTAGLMENAYRELCRTARGVAEPLGAPREPMDVDLESASRPRQI